MSTIPIRLTRPDLLRSQKYSCPTINARETAHNSQTEGRDLSVFLSYQQQLEKHSFKISYLFGFCTFGLSLMPRSHIHGSALQFYYGLNLTDDPGNDNFSSPIRMHYIRMIKYYYV